MNCSRGATRVNILQSVQGLESGTAIFNMTLILHKRNRTASQLLAAILFLLGFAYAQPVSKAITTQIDGRNAILLGTDWYPEQWPEARWEEDLRLMEAAHIKVVRIAEFAWSRMEPSENHFDFEWLERAINLAAKHGIVSVLGTPTAAPPAWLTFKYPDTLRIDEHGRRATHGIRAHGSATSPRYRESCRRIADQMVLRFGHNRNVAGWQIDNEYGYARMSFDDVTKNSFQSWLKAKYKSLDSLNEHWTTSYWSQTYDDWREIPIPGEEAEFHNPGLRLEWNRFVTDTWADYQQNQIDVIRQHADPRQFITGNFMGFFDGFDHYFISRPLTFASWDDYVGTGHLDPVGNGLTHDLVRGFKRENFWVIETQPGAVNWAGVNNFLNKGEVRVMAWQAIGHGADEVGYWQWRSALNGQEQYHGTLVGPDGTPVPLYEEVKTIGSEFAKAESALRGTTPVSEVALLNSYDSRWAIEFQRHSTKYDPVALLKTYCRFLSPLSQSIDVISPDAPLQDYKLVVAPSLNVIPDNLAQHLSEYVRNGGHLVLGPRSGMKDEFNALLPQRQPGFMADALGGRVEQYYALEKDFPVSGAWGEGQVTIWAEQLKTLVPDAEVLLQYGPSNGWLDGQPAALTHKFGKGRITYIGVVLDERLMATAAKWMVDMSGVKPVFGRVPDGVEVCRRVGGGKEVFIVINHTQERQPVRLPRPMTLVLEDGEVSAVDIPAYGVSVLADNNAK
jgi:beta-galactosidase